MSAVEQYVTEQYYLSPDDLDAEARYMHELHPAKGPARCPDCNLFSASPWETVSGTQDGNIYRWGGICKTHGAWSDGS